SRSLGDVLSGSIPTSDAVQEVDGIMVLTSKFGPQTPHGLLLRTDRVAAVLRDLRDSADLVVIDAPPVDAADTLAVAPLSDGVLFVAKADKTAPQAVERARARLGMLGARVVGGVLTDVDPAHARARARPVVPSSGPGLSVHAIAAPDGDRDTPSPV